ncbi:MAG TPA: L-glutamate gamma-semialdehyde dehydrogenase [Gemmatimonadales bacterium]|nr:L-glutamate gamma-semialdehyde dehydrogenase [Gemmatimonadales bacterium]
MSAIGNIPVPRNEPVRSYAPGTAERTELQAAIRDLGDNVTEIPNVINGEHIYSSSPKGVFSPQRHRHRVADLNGVAPADLERAISGAVEAQRDWAAMRFEDRAAVFLRAAELLAGPWRQRVNAATLLGQGKTPHQAEIDAACELIDFLRFNVHYAERLLHEQPQSSDNAWNRLDYRPLEGFVYAITPFNFTAIGGNLPTAPAMMGNSVLWKPSHTASLSNWLFYRILEEAGLPPGVIQFVPGDSVAVSDALLASRDFAGIHFTGSTAVFHQLWRKAGENLDRYRGYPRIVGETGGKDFILAHPSADVAAFTTALLRAAYEYQGQKCSAASRCYIPRSLWPEVRDRMVAEIASMKVGDPADFGVFVGAVIDERAWTRLDGVLSAARVDPGVEIIAGGNADRSEGWFVSPTLVRVDDPRHRMMREEFFGPILTAYVYDDDDWNDVLELVDTTAEYALTGAVFARDQRAINQADRALRNAAGNYYVNDKCTGAVVGQQPFGGGRASGTNDKAGSILNLYRWVSPRTIKEVGSPPVDWRYPYLG